MLRYAHLCPSISPLATAILVASCTNYSPEPLAGHSAALSQRESAVFAVSNTDAAARCRLRATSAFRAAAKQQSSSDLVENRLNEEVVSYQSGNFGATCALASGWLTLLDKENFAQYRQGATEPSRNAIQDAAMEAIRVLAEDGVIESAQLDWDNVRYSTTEAGGGEGAGSPEVGPFYVQSKVTLPRKIEGVAVVGNGIKITVDSELRIVGIQVFWRSLEKVIASPPIIKTIDAALAELVQRGSVQASHVRQRALAYVDSGVRSSQDYFEPWFVFDTKGSPNDKRHLHLVEAIATVQSPEVRAQIEGVVEVDRDGLR